MTKMISIIICTYNRASMLHRLLHSLAGQTLAADDFEVIVVDDGSTDSTADVCNAAVKDMPNLRYIPTGKNRGLGSAANLGVKSAKGDCLIFTDDDCIPRQDWAENMIQALEKNPLVGGCVTSPTSNYIKLCHNIAEFHRFMPGRKAGVTDFIAGANMGFWRALYDEIQGFPTGHILSPDMQFILKAREKGYSICFVPNAVITHDHDRTSLANIFSYAEDHAAETILLRSRYRKLLKTPFVLLSPGLLLVTAPVIAAKVTAEIYFCNTSNMKFMMTAPVVYALKLAWCWGAVRGLKNSRKIRQSEIIHEEAN